MGIFPCPLLRLLRALPALNPFTGLLSFGLNWCSAGSQAVGADQLVLLVTDCLLTLETELVSHMEHPFYVHVYMKNKVVDPHNELKKENKSGSIGWDAASTSKPFTNTSHCGIQSMRVRWMRSCTVHQSLWLHVTHHQENQHWTVTWTKSATWSQAWRKQRLLVMCLHIRKLKKIFTGIASLENFNNKMVLKSVIYFFCYSCLFVCHFPTSICREFRAGL